MGQPELAAQTESNEARLALAAQFVPAGARVIDLSGGAALRRHLPYGCSYKNVKAHAALAACDVVVMLDLLDRIEDAEALFAKLAHGTGAVVLNYHPRDFAEAPAPNKRLGFYDLARLFDQFGFRIASSAPLATGEIMLRLARTEGAPPPTARIAVLAEGDGFGDRLGLQILASLIPGHADVDYLTCGWLAAARPQYDLVIIGAGNSLTPGDARRRHDRSCRPRQRSDRLVRHPASRIDAARRGRAADRLARHLVCAEQPTIFCSTASAPVSILATG